MSSKKLCSSRAGKESEGVHGRSGCVDKAATLKAAENTLDNLETKWGEKYPLMIKFWRRKWPTLSAYFKRPYYVRTAIYITNAIYRQFRKLTKTKCEFTNKNSLLKLLLCRDTQGFRALNSPDAELQPHAVTD